MKKLFILILLAATGTAALSQNTHLNFKHGLKFSNLSSYEGRTWQKMPPNGLGTYYFYHESVYRLLHPTIAFQWNPGKGNFHELSLEDLKYEIASNSTELRNDSLNIQTWVSGERVTETAIALRYEYILVLNKKKECRLVPSIGFGASIYYRSYKAQPIVTTFFPMSEKITGLRTFITPRLNYFIGSRLFLDLNVPLCFTEAVFVSDQEENPSVPQQEREVSTFGMKMFPNILAVRLGVGIKL